LPRLIRFDRFWGIYVQRFLNIDKGPMNSTPLYLSTEVVTVNIWEEAKKQIRSEIPKTSFSMWISPLSLQEKKGDTFVLECPNKFTLKWISENYFKMIRAKLCALAQKERDLTLEVKPTKKTTPAPPTIRESRQLFLGQNPSQNLLGRKWLNHDFTFDRFVVGNCNEFAYSASRAIALGEHWPYNHLYIYSATGLGKSHLSQAIGHAVLEQRRNRKVCYITAEDFVNEMVLALKSNRIDDFKNKYRRTCDVLLLEEVHFLSGKERTQLELGYTLDALANDRKKIIFTSSLLPKDIPNLSRELSSRLTSGVITNLGQPDYNTRLKIIGKKAKEQGLSLSEEVIHLLSKHLTRDIRQMESALRCVKAKSDLLSAKIDQDLVQDVVRCHVSDQRTITMENVEKIVCRYYKVDPLLLRSKSRKKIHAYPRNVYVYLCRHHTESTVEEIGRSINRTHSTVLYASEVIEHKMQVDGKIKNQIDFLEKKLKEAIQ